MFVQVTAKNVRGVFYETQCIFMKIILSQSLLDNDSDPGEIVGVQEPRPLRWQA